MTGGHSLTRLLIVQVILISLLLTACRFYIVNTQVGALLADVRKNILTSRLWEVGSYLRADSENHVVLSIPPTRTDLYAGPGMDYVIRDRKGAVLFHSPPPSVNYTPPKTPAPGEIYEFEFTAPDGSPFVGQSGWVVFNDVPYLVQITLDKNLAGQFPDQLKRQFFYKYACMTVFFFGFLALTIVFSVRYSMKSINAVSRQAQEISFANPGNRLAAGNLPVEIKPLVEAFNKVLERLEAGIRAQKEFTAHVAHELRTPLSLLQTQLDLLEDKDTKEKLGGDVRSMGRMVEQLLAAARLEHSASLDMKKTDLAAVLRDACLAIWPLMVSRPARLEVAGAEEPVWIDGNEDSISRALRNVLENAMHHAPEDSVVSVSLSGREVRVRDRGPGVAVEDRERVFEMFWRKEPKDAGGAGVGLYIVRTTMTLHGGSVRVEGAPGGGSVFVLSFPPPA